MPKKTEMKAKVESNFKFNFKSNFEFKKRLKALRFQPLAF